MRLLIVGPDDGHIALGCHRAAERGVPAFHRPDIPQAMAALRSGKGAELLMVDVQLSVQTLVAALHDARIHVPLVACGVGHKKTSAVTAIRVGAKEYLPLPPDPELIAGVIEALSEDTRDVLYVDPSMEALMAQADRMAMGDGCVVIMGETGAGKGTVARYMHEKSPRSTKPFVKVTCSAIPPPLLASELFGYEKGAFPGALEGRVGKFEEADGGTVLLEGITALDEGMQGKLLGVLERREITRMGGDQPSKVDVRVFISSRGDLEEEVKRGALRRDLYDGLRKCALHVPPLRGRPKDIPLLAKHFIDTQARAHDLPNRCLSKDAMSKLLSHSWPGNILELRNTCHRAVLVSDGSVVDEDNIAVTPPASAGRGNTGPGVDLHPGRSSSPGVGGGALGEGRDLDTYGMASLVGKRLDEVEKRLITATLVHCSGNRTQAARMLGISTRTLRNKLRQYGGG